MRFQIASGLAWKPLLKRLLRALSGRGFTIRRTFDLQRARQALKTNDDGMCPLHRSEPCSCQYLVLHVSGAGTTASVVILHGHDRATKVSVISAAGQRLNAALAAALSEALQNGEGSPRTGSITAGYRPGGGSPIPKPVAVTLAKEKRHE